jgi:broad specificity polyphosphatase/5'/3'-nucleotidase SurE
VFLADDEGGPHGEHYLPGEPSGSGDWVDTDFDVVASGGVAVTPLRYDLLDPDLLADLAGWNLDLERLRERHG